MSPGHPEDPARLHAIEDRLASQRLRDLLTAHEAPAVSREQLERAHDAGYLQSLADMSPVDGLAYIDPDTQMNPQTLTAAARAAGAGVLAVDLVMRKEAPNAFCNVRPPGHHAEHRRAMGFCFYNNIAVAAAHALSRHGLRRVAIVDFDVHFGNGTRDIFLDDDRVMLCSLYEERNYPFVDLPPTERQHINTALPGRGFAQGMREAVTNIWVPALDEFNPQLYLISAGFDAHAEDMLSGGDMTETDYEWITGEIMALADRHASGRVVSMLEGGYALDAVARSAGAHLRCLMGV